MVFDLWIVVASIKPHDVAGSGGAVSLFWGMVFRQCWLVWFVVV